MSEDLPQNSEIFVESLREHMRRVRSTATVHHNKPRAFILKNLYTCSHVFVRVDAVKKPLDCPYEGPYKVISRPSDRVFKLHIHGREEIVSTERLKPAYIEAIPPDQELQDDIPVQQPPVKTYSRKVNSQFKSKLLGGEKL